MSFPSTSFVGKLMNSPARPGTLRWIGVRPARLAPLLTPHVAILNAGRGVEGDHYDAGENGARQITLIAREDIAAIASFLGREDIVPELLRRNFVTQGINLAALKGRRFLIGSAALEATGECAPCSRMEKILGAGGYNAMRGRGGITARIIAGGTVQIGEAVRRDDEPSQAPS